MIYHYRTKDILLLSTLFIVYFNLYAKGQLSYFPMIFCLPLKENKLGFFSFSYNNSVMLFCTSISVTNIEIVNELLQSEMFKSYIT